MVDRMAVLEEIESRVEIYLYLEELRDGRLGHYASIVDDLRFRFNLTAKESMDVLKSWFDQYDKV